MAMGLFGFGNKKEGGLMDVIRCDEADYLVWKWSPTGEKSRKENAIRYGSSLRVKAGEVAVLVYKQEDKMMDFIEGPFDQTIKTANLPILTSLVGMAYGGDSPFQAEIYFINLAGSVRLPFFVDWFDISDPNFKQLSIPAQVKGSITFCISDYKRFVNHYRMRSFDLDDLSLQVRDMVIGIVKDCVESAPFNLNIPVNQVERGIGVIRKSVESEAKPEMEDIFSISIRRLDISDIKLDKQSIGYKQLMDIGIIQTEDMKSDYGVKIVDKFAQQEINAEESKRRQKLATESAFLGAHQINVQGDVARTAAESLGMMNANMGLGEGGGMNPAGMMTGMMMGGAIGGNMANMMGNMMNGMSQQTPPPPPSAAISQYYIAINGQQSGPYNMVQLQQLAQSGQFTPNTYVWRQSMPAWEIASRVPELMSLFGAVPPPVPPVPPTL